MYYYITNRSICVQYGDPSCSLTFVMPSNASSISLSMCRLDISCFFVLLLKWIKSRTPVSVHDLSPPKSKHGKQKKPFSTSQPHTHFDLVYMSRLKVRMYGFPRLMHICSMRRSGTGRPEDIPNCKSIKFCKNRCVANNYLRFLLLFLLRTCSWKIPSCGLNRILGNCVDSDSKTKSFRFRFLIRARRCILV